MTAVCHFKFSDVQDYKLLRFVAEMLHFLDFEDGGRRYLGFSKVRNFNGLSAVWGPICATMPNFVKNRSNGCTDMAI